MAAPLRDVRDDWARDLELLVLQPTPFCNLDCSYCYLPNRDDKRRMSMAELDAIVAAVVAGGFARPELSLVWHAGEPLVVGKAWYEEAFAVVRRHLPKGTTVRHQFQTNAVLLDPSWCELVKRHEVSIGVSVDGPAFLHDAKRKTRDGRGTHAKVMRGVQHLRDAGIPFHAICVLGLESLEHPDAVFDFFLELGATQVGFNVEEIEASNATSSLSAARAPLALRAFWRRILERQAAADTFLRIREVEGVMDAVRSPVFGAVTGTSQNQAGRILTVGWDGAFTTWSPELLGIVHPTLGSLALGASLRGGLDDGAKRRLAIFQDEIDRGVAACRQTCKYFDFCIGGAPSNKLGEHGRFDVTETMYCRLTEHAVVDVVLEALDAALPR